MATSATKTVRGVLLLSLTGTLVLTVGFASQLLPETSPVSRGAAFGAMAECIGLSRKTGHIASVQQPNEVQ